MKSYTIKVNGVDVEYVRVNNDVNGNPRYIIHFLDIADTYAEALNISRKIGGKKYRGKDFGGGIVIQSYNLHTDLEHIVKGA